MAGSAVAGHSALRVSVLMGEYNAKAFVAEAMQNILKQTYRDFEPLVVDDGTTDAQRRSFADT